MTPATDAAGDSNFNILAIPTSKIQNFNEKKNPPSPGYDMLREYSEDKAVSDQSRKEYNGQPWNKYAYGVQ
jgi:hypothetical protein